MRVFLFQTAKGLFASSGGYKANLSILRHASSQGHATAQMCYAYRDEVKYYCTEMEAEGRKPSLTRSTLQVPLDDGSSTGVIIYVFVNKEGIRVIALDLDDFEKAFPKKLMASETTDFVDVSTTSNRAESSQGLTERREREQADDSTCSSSS